MLAPASMRRPVWLFSMDTEEFAAPPMTTGGLKAFSLRYGTTSSETEMELVHFLRPGDLERWRESQFLTLDERVVSALAAGVRPIFGFSCYTWNVAEFLEMASERSAKTK